MRAYSEDLRKRVADACKQPGATVGQVAARFSVSESFVRKMRRRERTTGSLTALAHSGGPAPLRGPGAQVLLVACLRQQPDATLDELGLWLAAAGGPAVSRATLGRAVQALDWRRKKRACTRPSATPNGS
ncbi:MAG: hypothetical protein ACRYFR_03745 [Janthinobacterium lividum]